jgi:hypothetical protein
MMVEKHQYGKWSCARVFAGVRVFLVEGDLVEEVFARHMYQIAADAWNRRIRTEQEELLSLEDDVDFDTLLTQKGGGQREVTFKFFKLCFEALHPDWEYVSTPISTLTSVGV